MAFGFDVNTLAANHREITGRQIKIACLCWFTSTGRAMPLRIKVEDEAGEIRTLDVHVNSHEEKNYCGIPFIEYKCNLMIQDKAIHVKLIYFKQDNSWSMVI